ncbi:hypothetical protein BsWGS_10498 [Bradybaena similaris]
MLPGISWVSSFTLSLWVPLQCPWDKISVVSVSVAIVCWPTPNSPPLYWLETGSWIQRTQLAEIIFSTFASYELVHEVYSNRAKHYSEVQQQNEKTVARSIAE